MTTPGGMQISTFFVLMAQYNATVIPIDRVAKDFFAPLTTENLMRKILVGQIALPIIRMDHRSQKSARAVHIADLAAFIDEARAKALKERDQLCGKS